MHAMTFMPFWEHRMVFGLLRGFPSRPRCRTRGTRIWSRDMDPSGFHPLVRSWYATTIGSLLCCLNADLNIGEV